MINPIYFTSCNEEYLQKFVKSFVASSVDAKINNKFVIDVCPTTQLSFNSVALINEIKNNFANFDFISVDPLHLLEDNWPSKKTYYACRRFLLMPELLLRYKKLWVTDIDVMFLKAFPEIQSCLGYSLSLEKPRPGSKNYERRKTGTIIKGDMIYADDRFYDQAVRIREHILASDRKWYADQLALFDVFNNVNDYQLVTRSAMKRSELNKWNNDSYLISPGGTYKKKLEVKEDFAYFDQRYYSLINSKKEDK